MEGRHDTSGHVQCQMEGLPSRHAAFIQTSQRQSSISSFQESGPEQCVVLEITSQVVRAGLSGESTPRAILPLPESTLQASTANENHRGELVLTINRDNFLSELEDRVELIVRDILNRFLYISLKGKQVVFLEDHYMSIPVKRILARVLFTYHQPRAVDFLPASVCSLLALGARSGTVLDLGFEESVVIPVYDSRPLNVLVQSTRVGMKSMLDRASYLLHHYGRPEPSNITRDDLEDFTSRAAVCLARSALDNSRQCNMIQNSDLCQQYNIDPYANKTFAWTQPSNRAVITLPQWVRTAIPEVLFETGGPYTDSCLWSIPKCLSSVIKGAEMDLKKPLSNILITGDLCHLPGLLTRIGKETGLHILSNEFTENVSWTGASLATSLGLVGRKVTLTQFTHSGTVPDWCRRLSH